MCTADMVLDKMYNDGTLTVEWADTSDMSDSFEDFVGTAILPLLEVKEPRFYNGAPHGDKHLVFEKFHSDYRLDGKWIVKHTPQIPDTH